MWQIHNKLLKKEMDVKSDIEVQSVKSELSDQSYLSNALTFGD